MHRGLCLRSTGRNAVTIMGYTSLSAHTLHSKDYFHTAGARLRIDGKSRMTHYSGKHKTAFGFVHLESQQGSGTPLGSTPLEVGPCDELPGRSSITFELGACFPKTPWNFGTARVLLCDVLSMSMAQITVRVAGQDQTILYDRKIALKKKSRLVERERRSFNSLVCHQPETKYDGLFPPCLGSQTGSQHCHQPSYTAGTPIQYVKIVG